MYSTIELGQSSLLPVLIIFGDKSKRGRHQQTIPGNNVEMATTGGSTTAGNSSASRVNQVTDHVVGRVVEADRAEAC